MLMVEETVKCLLSGHFRSLKIIPFSRATIRLAGRSIILILRTFNNPWKDISTEKYMIMNSILNKRKSQLHQIIIAMLLLRIRVKKITKMK